MHKHHVGFHAVKGNPRPAKLDQLLLLNPCDVGILLTSELQQGHENCLSRPERPHSAKFGPAGHRGVKLNVSVEASQAYPLKSPAPGLTRAARPHPPARPVVRL